MSSAIRELFSGREAKVQVMDNSSLIARSKNKQTNKTENFIIILTLKHITIIWVVRAALNWRTKGSSCSSPTAISWSRWLWSWPPSRVATMNPWSLKPLTEKLEDYDRELPLVNCHKYFKCLKFELPWNVYLIIFDSRDLYKFHCITYYYA